MANNPSLIGNRIIWSGLPAGGWLLLLSRASRSNGEQLSMFKLLWEKISVVLHSSDKIGLEPWRFGIDHVLEDSQAVQPPNIEIHG